LVLETRHGMLVQRLVEAGYTVLPVNPDLLARRRGPARNKDDAADARIACLLALDRHTSLRPLIPHGDLAGELRAIARDDDRAAGDQRRPRNRLRQDLLSTFPATLQLAADDLGAPTILRLLGRWPTRQQLAAATHQELVAFAGAGRHGWPERFADQVTAALTGDHCIARDYLVRAKADTIRLAATQLLVIGTNAGPGSGAWASCWVAPPDMGEAASHERASWGRRSLAAGST
jgi:Transposase